MLVTWAFTVTAAVSLARHLWKLRKHGQNWRATRRWRRDSQLPALTGDELQTASMLLAWAAILALVNLILLVVGVGVLIGHREVALALAAIPLVTLAASYFDPV